MKRNTVKHLQAMGIVLMTGITLGSIAPSANALKSIDGNLTAQASRVHRHHRKNYRNTKHQRKHIKLSRARLHKIYARAMTKAQRNHRDSLIKLRHKYANALRANRAELSRLNARISRDEAKAGQKHTKHIAKPNHAVENKLRAEVKANRALIMHIEKAHLVQSRHVNNELKGALRSNKSLQGQIHQDRLVIGQLRKMNHTKKAKKAPKAKSHRLNNVLASLAKNTQRINQLQKSVNTYKTVNVAQGKQLTNAKRALTKAEHQKASVQKRVNTAHKNYQRYQLKLNKLNRSVNAKISSAISKATANQRNYDSSMIKNVSRKYESQLSSSNATNRSLIRELKDSHAKDEAKLVEAIHQEDIAQQRVQAFIQASNKKAKQNAKASKTNTGTASNNNANNSYAYTNTNASTGDTGNTPATTTANTSNVTPSGISSFNNNMMMAVNDNKKIKKYASHQSPKTKKAISKAVAHNNETNKIIKSGGQHVVHESVNQLSLDDNVNYVINLNKKAQRSKNRKKAKKAKEKLDASILAGSWNSKKQRQQLKKMDKKNEAAENKNISGDLNSRNGDIDSKKMKAKEDDYLIGLAGGRSAEDKAKAQAIFSKEKNINIPKLIKKIKGHSKKAKRARKALRNAEKSLKKKNISVNKPNSSKKNKKNKKGKKGKKKSKSSKKLTETWIPPKYVKGKWHKGYRGKNGKWHKGYRSHGHYTKGYMKFNGSKSQVAKADAKSIMDLNSDIAKLKSGRQTKATKLKIHEDTVAKNKLDQQMIKSLEDQMDKLIHQKDYDEQQLSYQKQEYSYHEPDANHVDHLMQGQLYWKNKIKAINKKINKLEAQIQKLGGMIYGNEANEKIDEFNAEIDGDLSKVQPLDSQVEDYLKKDPQYVVVTTPTYYFDDYDISNPNVRDLAIQPGQPSNNPYHRVLNAYEVTLKSGRSFDMYRVTSNDDRDAYSYLIMASATQQETPPVKHYHVHSYQYDRKIYVTHGEAYEYSALPSKHLNDNATIEGVMRMGYRDLQGHRARIVRAYYFNKSKKNPFAYELSDGKYVKAGDVYVQSSSHLHAAKFSDSDIDNWVNGSI